MGFIQPEGFHTTLYETPWRYGLCNHPPFQVEYNEVYGIYDVYEFDYQVFRLLS